MARLLERLGKLRRCGCRQDSWSRRRTNSGLASRPGTAAVRTGEAVRNEHRTLMNVATKT